jgi:hypothetical protein
LHTFIDLEGFLRLDLVLSRFESSSFLRDTCSIGSSSLPGTISPPELAMRVKKYHSSENVVKIKIELDVLNIILLEPHSYTELFKHT